MPHNLPYAHDHESLAFVEAIDAIRPHVLIEPLALPERFTRTVIERMAAINKRLVIFALSNPTSKAECTAEQAYSWSGGRAVFASGSPATVIFGRTLRPGQGNNAYVFPGIGLGAGGRARTCPTNCSWQLRGRSQAWFDRTISTRIALSAAEEDPQALTRDRGERCEQGIRDEPGAREAAEEPTAAHQGAMYEP